MGASSTKEYCRNCGDITLYKINKRENGFIMWKVICPKCKGELGGIERSE